jgi:hypothetical protein
MRRVLFVIVTLFVLELASAIPNLGLENLRYPLDAQTYALAKQANLITSMPDLDKKAPFVVTPFGVFGRECVHGHESGAHVSELDSGDLLIKFENGTSYVYPSSKYHCKERFAPENVLARRKRSNSISPAPLDGWLDNGWFFDTVELGSFTSNYVVPSTPPNPSGQTLFWFVGLECQNSLLAILQPVLTFNNIVTGWSFASWYCCPSGTPNYATPIQGFGPDSTLAGYITANSQSNPDYTVKSCNGPTCSTLACPSNGRQYTYGDTTLETYGVTNCNQFAPGAMKFTNMALTDLGGSPYTPQWQQITGPTECGGSISFSGNTCTITHS